MFVRLDWHIDKKQGYKTQFSKYLTYYTPYSVFNYIMGAQFRGPNSKFGVPV